MRRDLRPKPCFRIRYIDADKIKERRSYDPNLLHGMRDPFVQISQIRTRASCEVLHRWDRSRLHTGRSHLSRMWTVLRSASNHPWPIGKQNHPGESLRAPVEPKQRASRDVPGIPNRVFWGLARTRACPLILRSDFPPGEFSIVSPKSRAVILGAWHGLVPVP